MPRTYRRKRFYTTAQRILVHLSPQGHPEPPGPEAFTQDGIAAGTRSGRSTVTKWLARLEARGLLAHDRIHLDGYLLPKIVYRLTRNGEVSAYLAPDMSQVEWSRAQKAHRQFFKECVAYAKLAVRDPDIRQFYMEMAKKSKRSKGRPFDMAVSDYHNGNDMLWLKLYGDQVKPDDWRW